MQLQVGYHILEGRRVALKKPMAILETLKPDSQEQHGSSSSGSSSSSPSSTHCKVRLDLPQAPQDQGHLQRSPRKLGVLG